MARRLLFRVTSPLGYTVVITRDRWRQIVRFKHPALTGHERLVQGCIREPETIRESAKDAAVHLYYSGSPRGYLCVAVAPSTEEEYFVVTGYFTDEIKKGRDLWRR